jgi:hypothetical protein
VSIECFLEDLHNDQVLVDRLTSLFIDCTKLKLIVCHLVVFGLERNADFQQLAFHFLQDILNFEWQLSIVMIRKLLIFSSCASEQTSTSHSEVMTLQVGGLGDDKELLLKPKCEEDVLVLNSKRS